MLVYLVEIGCERDVECGSWETRSQQRTPFCVGVVYAPERRDSGKPGHTAIEGEIKGSIFPSRSRWRSFPGSSSCREPPRTTIPWSYSHDSETDAGSQVVIIGRNARGWTRGLYSWKLHGANQQT